MWNDFKKFIMKGNVLDLAVGVIIGGAFGKIVSSLVNDLIMPLIALIMPGGTDFSQWYLTRSGTSYPSLADAQAAEAVFAYGNFISAVIDFFIIAACIFLIVRLVGRLTKKPEVKPEVTTKECPYCLSTIPVKATKCAHCTSDVSAL